MDIWRVIGWMCMDISRVMGWMCMDMLSRCTATDHRRHGRRMMVVFASNHQVAYYSVVVCLCLLSAWACGVG